MATTKVPAEFLADNTISGTIIADNAVTAVHIATNAISGTLIADNAVTTVHIAENNVTSTSIVQNAITATQIATNAINTLQIADVQVTSAKIANNAILTQHIDDNQVDSDQLADNSVTAAQIADGSITATQLGANSVTLAKMASLTRGSVLIGNSSADVTALGIGTNDYVLTSDGTDIAWEAASSFDADAAQVFNESGADVDFRVESDDNANMLFIDGGNDRIGIGEGSPDVPLHITEAGSDGYETLLKMERSHASGDEVGLEWHLTGSGGTAQAAGMFAWKGEDFSGSTSRSAGLSLTCKENGTDQNMYQLGTFSDGVTGHKWLTQGAQRMCISHAGYVGIGTTTPVHPLQVNVDNDGIMINNSGQTNGEFAALYFTAHSVPAPFPKMAIASKRTGDYGIGDMYFALDSNGDEADINIDTDVKMVIKNDGKVGIGTTSPAGVLDIPSGSYSATKPAMMLGGDIDTTGAGGRTDNTRKYSSIVGYHYSNEEQPVGILGYDCQSDSVAIANIGIPSASYNNLTAIKFHTAANSITTTSTERFVINSEDSVNMNSPSGDVRFNFLVGGTQYWNLAVDTGGSPGGNSIWFGDAEDDNGVYVTQGNSAWSGISDERLKRNWTNLTGATDKINTLTKVGTFERRGKTTGNWSSDKEVGLSAQEVEAILPEAVDTGGDIDFGGGDTVEGVKGLSYERLVPLLVKAIQELNTRLKAVE